jgi:5S rRNA maturation endonuclease (ribonuclease M5)
MIELNIELSAEFSRYLFEHPEIEERIPLDAEIILLLDFDRELKEYNSQLGRNIENEGGKVFYISIKQIRPKALSRIEKIELESIA